MRAANVATAQDVYSSGNRVLDALPAIDRAGLEADLQIITLEAHKFTHSSGGVLDHVDFPIDAVLSVVATLTNGDSVEVSTPRGNKSYEIVTVAFG